MMLAFRQGGGAGRGGPAARRGRAGGDAKTPGATFEDCPQCPDMVVLPAGKFLMGSPNSEKYRGAEAQHPVTIRKPFAVGKYEVAFDQWDACVKGGGCGGYSPPDEGWGRQRQPVIHMNYPDAQGLCRLAEQDHRPPLPAAVGSRVRICGAGRGSGAAFAFGEPDHRHAGQFRRQFLDLDQSQGAHQARTVRVGSFAPNRFGLHDLHGNVWEWTEDCWHDDYAGAPADGSPGRCVAARAASCAAGRGKTMPATSARPRGWAVSRTTAPIPTASGSPATCPERRRRPRHHDPLAGRPRLVLSPEPCLLSSSI